MRKAREHYFTTHPWDWAHGNMDDLSDIFRELAQGTGLLGDSISQDTTSMEWARGLETCQLCSSIPTQRGKVPKGGVCQGIPQNHGPNGDP